MDLNQALMMLLPIAVSAGVNLYLTTLVVGITIRMGWLANVPAGLEILASWPVLIVAGVLFLFEFLATKIQFIDNIWDFFHTFIRPLGAAAIGYGMITNIDPQIATAMGLASGSVALVSHSGKAGSRIALNVASPAENASNIGLSIVEDLGVAMLTYLAMQYPLLAAGIALVVLVILLLVAPRLIRWTWFTLRAVGARISGLGGGIRQSEPLPPEQAALLDSQQPTLTVQVTGENIKGGNGRRGYAALAGNHLLFLYRSWFKHRRWQIDLGQIVGTSFRRRALMDVLEVRYHDDQQRQQLARFVFLKNRGALAEQLATRLNAQRA